MLLLKIGLPQTCFEIALTWSSSKGQTLDKGRIHQEQLVKKVSQFPPGRMVILAKEIIMIGPLARGARHNIILLGHQRTNIITPGKLSQPSYLTEIQI